MPDIKNYFMFLVYVKKKILLFRFLLEFSDVKQSVKMC